KKTTAASKPASLPASAPAPAVKNTPVPAKAAVSTPVEKKPAVKASAKPAITAPAEKTAKEQRPAEKSKMIGIRPLFEGEGKVYWNEEYKCVRAVSKKHDVRFQIGSPQAIVNAQAVKLDHPSVLDDGRALVPETFIIDTLKMQINGK
ncbi:MAG TPA: hypothetical protein DCL60_01280, partial [Armatimonadetes bacterium]|nr:hypothetical protein [Armatimonadota bacterium]